MKHENLKSLLMPIALLCMCCGTPAKHPAPAEPDEQHTLFLVDTSGSAFKAKYLGKPYLDVISRVLYSCPVGSTATFICYDASAGFYPTAREMNTIDDVRQDIQKQIFQMRDYWKSQERTFNGDADLESNSRGGTRLDRALEKAMDDRQQWATNAKVSIYFLTDGGVDFRRKDKVKLTENEINRALNYISNTMKELCQDPRVRSIQLCGLREQSDIVRPSLIFGKRSIRQQWVHRWLGGVKNVTTIKITNSGG